MTEEVKRFDWPISSVRCKYGINIDIELMNGGIMVVGICRHPTFSTNTNLLFICTCANCPGADGEMLESYPEVKG